MTDRRSFVAWLGSLPLVGRHRLQRAAPPLVIDATPTALYQQPDGRNNLVRVAVTGLDTPAARARVTDRRGTLVGTAGLLSTGAGLAGELWVPLSRAVGAEFQIDVELGKQRVGRRRVRLAAPLRVLLNIHIDTVYPADHPFQRVEQIDHNTLRGPGVIDAKGGLVVMLTA